jgi:hypothetical protein
VVLVLREVATEVKGVVVYERVRLLKYRKSFDKGRPVEKWFRAKQVVQNVVVEIV